MTNVANRPVIIESPEYAADAHALLASQHIFNMFVSLPENIKEALRTGEHVEGFIGAANAEWTRRNDANESPLPAPKFLGSVERALRIVAAVDAGAE
jgi:hypothetical protein